MAVGASDLAFVYLFGKRGSPSAVRYHRRNAINLRSGHMVKVEHNHVGLAAVHTWITSEMLYHEPAGLIYCPSCIISISLLVARVVGLVKPNPEAWLTVRQPGLPVSLRELLGWLLYLTVPANWHRCRSCYLLHPPVTRPHIGNLPAPETPTRASSARTLVPPLAPQGPPESRRRYPAWRHAPADLRQPRTSGAGLSLYLPYTSSGPGATGAKMPRKCPAPSMTSYRAIWPVSGSRPSM